jgi:exopolyphosphatase/pppGpp-phosphohydrolase
MNSQLKDYAWKLKRINNLVKEIIPNLPYHNYQHAREVEYAASNLAKKAKLSYEEKFLLKTAGKLHDVIQVIGAKDNEEQSAELAKRVLKSLGYDNYQRNIVCDLILATKMPQKPKSYLEKVICDADLDNLGREDFFKKGELFRVEMNLPKIKQFYEVQLQFLSSHNYHTQVAKDLRDAGKTRNIKKLKEILQENKNGI